jgi:hypothetical protein
MQVRHLGQLRLSLLLLSLCLALPGWAAQRAYYSTGQNVTTTPASSPNVSLAATADAAQLQLTATVKISTSGPTTVRLPLNGTAQAGDRAGILVSTDNAPTLLSLDKLLQLEAIGAITLRTYLGTTQQEEKLIDLSVVQLALLAGAGQPTQLEFSSTRPFDVIEVTFAQAARLGVVTKIRYAYAIGPDSPKAVKGFLSQFGTAATSQYDIANTSAGTGICANNLIRNPELAVDGDLTNYASFSTLASVGTGCGGTLKVQLAGTVPPTGYRAGFVIGNAGLADVGLLSALRLTTYLNNVAQETAIGSSLLQLTLLADDKAFISFPATKAFDAVSIERTAVLNLLNNLNIYYGFGLENATFTTNPISTSYPLARKEYTASTSGPCVGCGTTITTPTNGAPYLQFNQGLGLFTTQQVRFLLTKDGVVNSAGQVGNRAGIVLGQNTVLNVNALKDVTISTYDAGGNVLETATGSSLLAVSLLPGGRQEVSFRTTRDFAQVGLTVNKGVSLLDDLQIYSAFADDLGPLQVTSPIVPLPVVLISFGVSRAAGATAAEVAWATASEQHSARFVVERATDPQAGFRAIGQVAAAGTSSATHQYSLRDAAAPTGIILYYRLRQIDLDGSEQLSPVAVLAAAAATGAEGFSLYPKPAVGSTVSLSLASPVAAGTTVAIYSSVGRLLSQQPVQGGGQEQPATLSTAELPLGIYQVVLRDAAGHSLGAKRLVINQ